MIKIYFLPLTLGLTLVTWKPKNAVRNLEVSKWWPFIFRCPIPIPKNQILCLNVKYQELWLFTSFRYFIRHIAPNNNNNNNNYNNLIFVCIVKNWPTNIEFSSNEHCFKAVLEKTPNGQNVTISNSCDVCNAVIFSWTKNVLYDTNAYLFFTNVVLFFCFCSQKIQATKIQHQWLPQNHPASFWGVHLLK